ncbi:MAG: hypothetical protein HY731_07465 [Candidatus Tectomicrobia bacterium]|nr:hypothetical protein [Candidatus Tectomicrobia bacterium]
MENYDQRRQPILPYIILAIIFGVAFTMIYSSLTPKLRGVFLLVLSYLIFALVLSKLMGYLRRLFRQQPLYEALAPQTLSGDQLRRAPRLERLIEDVKNASHDDHYYHVVLKPKMLQVLDYKLKERYGISLESDVETLRNRLDPKLLKIFEKPGRSFFIRQRVPIEEIDHLLKALEEL